MEKNEAKRWKKHIIDPSRPFTAPPATTVPKTDKAEADSTPGFSTTRSLSPKTEKLKRGRFAPNLFWEQQRARIMWGDPDLNKFNPLQPGQFPAIVKGLPSPLVRGCNQQSSFFFSFFSSLTSHNSTTDSSVDFLGETVPNKPRSRGGEEKPNTFIDSIKGQSKTLSLQQISAAARLSKAIQSSEDQSDSD
jgi:hypothetical protein